MEDLRFILDVTVALLLVEAIKAGFRLPGILRGCQTYLPKHDAWFIDTLTGLFRRASYAFSLSASLCLVGLWIWLR